MFYERLQDTCRMRGIKITPLLEKANIPTSSIARFKQGSIPNGDTLAKLAEALDVSTDYLLGRTDDPTPLGAKNEAKVNYPHLIDASDLSEEDKKDLEKYVELLKFRARARNLNEKTSEELNLGFQD